MDTVKWGVIGGAKIVVEKVIPAIKKGENCEVVAIASSSSEKASLIANWFNIPKSYGSYEMILEDKNVEAVYIPLPNHLHVPWSMKALEAGKHVLCEKPIAMSAAEARSLLDFSFKYPSLKIMEAFMYRHHPQWQKAYDLVHSGEIGVVRTIQSFFSYSNVNAGDIRNNPEYGGGGLLDIGCYLVSLARFIFDREPLKAYGRMDYDMSFGTDRLTSGILDFGDATSTFTCSTQLIPYQKVNIFGTKGRLELEVPFNAPTDTPCKMWCQVGESVEEIVFPVRDQYTIQAEAFSNAILDDTEVPTPLDDAVMNMEVIDALIESAANGM